MRDLITITFILFSILFISCSNDQSSPAAIAVNAAVESKDQFKDYWYQGKAEINSFDLEQARYGEIHQGQAVMVFVTEEFSKSKKVKLDNPSQSPEDAVPVLKLNATRKFNTGVYPYSMMTSVFTPVDIKKQPNTLKVSSSSQEWCGHTFMQLREEKNHYAFELDSYFESEGDEEKKVEKAFLEDEIWTRLRINPKSLPTGNLKMLPGAKFSRLRHINYQAFPVNATLGKHKNNKDWMTYQIKYSGINRTLSIHFEKSFPFKIQGWEATMQSGFGPSAKALTTKATFKKSIMSNYWSRHNNDDLPLRDELGLPR